jgi:hypothetical protein
VLTRSSLPLGLIIRNPHQGVEEEKISDEIFDLSELEES